MTRKGPVRVLGWQRATVGGLPGGTPGPPACTTPTMGRHTTIEEDGHGRVIHR